MATMRIMIRSAPKWTHKANALDPPRGGGRHLKGQLGINTKHTLSTSWWWRVIVLLAKLSVIECNKFSRLAVKRGQDYRLRVNRLRVARGVVGGGSR